jgi:hypothetical protein
MENIDLNPQILKFTQDLSHPELYNRKHAAWMLARLAQKGEARAIVRAGAVPKLALCLKDPEMIVRYRALWALLEVVKHGQNDAVLALGIIPALAGMAADESEAETCHPGTDEIVRTTVGKLAGELLACLDVGPQDIEYGSR